MSPQPTRYVSVRFQCRNGHEHPLCVPFTRAGVPPQLFCAAPMATAHGASTCPLPADLEDRIRQALRDSMPKWLQLGHVVINDH